MDKGTFRKGGFQRGDLIALEVAAKGGSRFIYWSETPGRIGAALK